MTRSNEIKEEQAHRARVDWLAHMLRNRRGDLRYVDYHQAERDTEVLAARLMKSYCREELESFSFTAIPRGGLIVLGMLSYLLDLDHSRLNPGPGLSGPLVVVDDCALTGARFVRFLEGIKSPRVIFAHLYSHPKLREAIEEKESRVERCVAAHDLIDRAPRFYSKPDRYQEWRQWLQDRLGPEYYWVGMPEPVCFAWSEPDHPFWNPISERMEADWHFLPPHRCLKHRARLVPPLARERTRRWQAPGNVMNGIVDDIVWFCKAETGEVFSLQDVAADMWRALAGYGDLDTAVDYLVSRYDVDRNMLERHTESFLHSLIEAGLIEPVNRHRMNHEEKPA